MLYVKEFVLKPSRNDDRMNNNKNRKLLYY